MFTVLMVAPWYPAGPIQFTAQALERIGFRVVRFGPAYNNYMCLDWSADAVTPDQPFCGGSPLWNLDLAVDECTKRFQAPDMLLVSEENYQTNIIPTKKVPSVLWSFDGWPNCYERISMIEPTVAYCNQPLGNRLHPRIKEPLGWKFLPGAALYPFVHRPLGLERDIDFCLLATMYTKRPIIVEGLRERGFSVISGQQTTDGYIKSYNRSLTTLSNPGWYEIKWRWWENAACGCVNINWHTPLFDWLGYKPYEHYMPIETEETDDGPWPTVGAVVEQVSKLKRDKDQWRYISDTALKKVIGQDTYFHRIGVIFRDLGLCHQVAKVEDFLFALVGVVNALDKTEEA